VTYPHSYDSGAGQDYLVGTRCGKVLDDDNNTQNTLQGVDIKTDICARKGDSGGPLFSQLDHTAYGILEGNLQSRSGPCESGEFNNYIPLSTIYSTVDYWRNSGWTGGTTFRVITSANG
jgi:streptogrisin C